MDAETAARALHRSLSPSQRREICFDWDFIDPLRGRMRTFVSNHWHVTKPRIRSDFFTRPQQHLIHDAFTNLLDPEWYPRFLKQTDDDNAGHPWGSDQSIGLFGDPDRGPFQFVIGGRHLTLRGGGDEEARAAFGGPIMYGHQATGFREEPNHPGNVFWVQALRASRLAEMLDDAQRAEAVLPQLPPETAIGFRAQRPGLAVRFLTPEQKCELEETLAVLVEPFRAADQRRVRECLRRHGGLDECHLMFALDGRMSEPHFDNWRLEGPSFVWHFRGIPHVHVWVHVADDVAAPANAQQGALLFRASMGDLKSRDPLVLMALRSQAEGDMQGAVAFATAALAIPVGAGVAEPDENSVRPHAILYWALLWLGRREEAKPHFEVCRKSDPANPLYLDHARFFDDGSPAPGR